MATDLNFKIKNGLTAGGSSTITTSGQGAPHLNLRRTTEAGGYSWLQFSRTDGTRALELIANATTAAYGIPANAVGINAQSTNGLHFSTNDMLRMSIDGSGNIFSVSPLTEQRGLQTNYRINSTDAAPFYSVWLKARGTGAVPLIVQNNDQIGSLQFYGYDGTNDRQSASITVSVAGVPGTSTVPGRISFGTTPAGTSQTPIERMLITSTGEVRMNIVGDSSAVAFGGIATSNSLAVTGDINMVRFGTTTAIGMRYANGVAGTPTSVVSEDRLGALFMGGYHSGLGGGAWQNPTFIASFVDGDATGVTSAIPARLSFFTGALNSTRAERMRIDSVGNVGIGTTSPSSRLTVAGTSLFTSDMLVTGGSIQLRNGIPTYFWNSDSTNFMYLQNFAETGAGNGILAFVAQTGGERMRIDSVGNVGIGRTPSALCRLDVQGPGQTLIRIRGGTGSAEGAAFYVTQPGSDGTMFAVGDAGAIVGGTVGTTAMLWTNTAPLSFFVNGAERMRITSAGIIQDAFGRELGFRNIPPTSNTWTRGGANVITAGATVGTSAAGDVFSVYNDSAVAVTLSAAGITLRLGGTTASGNRTLLPYGFATIWYQSSTVAVVNGNVT